MNFTKKLPWLAVAFALALPVTTSAIGNGPTVSKIERISSLEGTYQIIWTTVKHRNYFSNEIEAFISDNRHQTDVKYFQLTETAFVKILPYDQINDPSFVPLEEVYIYDEDFRL